ncbi:MAG: hypothetical protein QM539_08650 [Alphaproteobacteria bacterium]|nr:hypothetical protein [Alphaproteobacteria bacterium]
MVRQKKSLNNLFIVGFTADTYLDATTLKYKGTLAVACQTLLNSSKQHHKL